MENELINIEQSLLKQEALFDDIIEGTEKKIYWFNETVSKTKLSIVYLHGFSASRQEMSPLIENIAQALNANTFFTRLTGHGRLNHAMKDLSVDALMSDAMEALRIGQKIGHRVLLIGTSTGATLATWLTATISNNKSKENMAQCEALAGLILLSPNYGLAHERAKYLTMPLAKYWLPYFKGRQFKFIPANAAQAKYWTCKFPTRALVTMMAFVKKTLRSPIESILTPVLILHSGKDENVSEDQIKQVFLRFNQASRSNNTAQLGLIHGVKSTHQHILCGDILSPNTTFIVEHRIMIFIHQLGLK